MKSLELLPTEENLMLAYEGDYIGRNTDIHYFFEILNLIFSQDHFTIDFIINKEMKCSKDDVL